MHLPVICHSSICQFFSNLLIYGHYTNYIYSAQTMPYKFVVHLLLSLATVLTKSFAGSGGREINHLFLKYIVLKRRACEQIYSALINGSINH